MRKCLVLAGVLLLVVVSMACSSEEIPQQERESLSETTSAPKSREDTEPSTSLETTQQDAKSESVSLGEAAKMGDFSVRIFDVRSEATVYYISGPGVIPESRNNSSGEYVAVDYVAENRSDGPMLADTEATLRDADGTDYAQEGSIVVQSGETGGMELEPGEKRASTMFFEVSSGTSSELLMLKAFGEKVQIDLTQNARSSIPPEDYLHVYHVYFNERAYEEIYDMFDPSSTQGITLGDWLTYFDPIWGE